MKTTNSNLDQFMTNMNKLHPALCPDCNRAHEARSFKSIEPGTILNVRCDECGEKHHRETLANEQSEKRCQQWEEMCPSRFRNFKPELFKGNQAKLDQALAWEYGPKGLVLHGHTGQGKSWAAFLIAEREFKLNNRSVAIVNGNRLRELAGLAFESSRAYSEQLANLIKVNLLIVNDPFKAKVTEKIEEALWEIIDERYEWERPLIVTMNGVARNIEPILSPDRGKALFRRLREENSSVHFPAPDAK